MQRVIDGGTPSVFYNKHMLGLVTNRVMIDNRLLHLGHRRIAIFMGDLTGSSGRQRLDGYQEAFQARDAPLEPCFLMALLRAEPHAFR